MSPLNVLWNIPLPWWTNQIVPRLWCMDVPVSVWYGYSAKCWKLHPKSENGAFYSIRLGIAFRLKLTVPGKKQMWFRSICLPKVIWSNDSLMWHVSMMSHSPADGCDRLADSLVRKEFFRLVAMHIERKIAEFNLPSRHNLFNILESVLQLSL